MTHRIHPTTAVYNDLAQEAYLIATAKAIFSDRCMNPVFTDFSDKVDEALKPSLFMRITDAIADGGFGSIYLVQNRKNLLSEAAFVLKFNNAFGWEIPQDDLSESSEVRENEDEESIKEQANSLDGDKAASILSQDETPDEQELLCQKFEREGDLLKRCHHHNIPQFSEFLPNPQHGYIMERCYTDLAKLQDHLRVQSQGFSLHQIQRMMREVLRGLQHMRSLNIVHRDVKPANFLVAADNDKITIKVGDLSESMELFYSLDEKILSSTIEVTTLWYRSPRVLTYDPDGLDQWSSGLSFIEMFTLIPFLQVNYSGSTIEQTQDLMRLAFENIKPPTSEFSKSIKWDKLIENHGISVLRAGASQEVRLEGEVKLIREALEEYSDRSDKKPDVIEKTIKLSRENLSQEMEKQEVSLKPFVEVIESLLDYEQPVSYEEALAKELFNIKF